MINNTNSNYSTDQVLVQPLVSYGSSGNVVPTNLCFYVLNWTESYPEFSATLGSGHQNIYQNNASLSGGGSFIAVINIESRDGHDQGNAYYSTTIGGTTFYTNKRRQATAIEMDIATENLHPNRSWAIRTHTYYDAPSFYFYERTFHGQVMSHGWNQRGLRFSTAASANRVNYDFTFVGLKP